MAESKASSSARTTSAKAAASIEDQIAAATDRAEQFISQFDLPQGMREVAERSLNQSRETYARLRDAAQDAVKLMETSAAKAGETATTLNLKTVDFAEANIEASFELMRKLLKTRDASEAMELQVAFATRQADALSAQAKELGELAAKAAQTAIEPFKSQFAKAAEQFRAGLPG